MPAAGFRPSRWPAAVGSALLAASLLITAPAAIEAHRGDASGSSSGSAGCRPWAPNGQCKEWNEPHPEGDSEWVGQFSALPSDAELKAKQKVDIRETYNDVGNLTKVTAIGELTTSNRDGGSAQSNVSYSVPFDAPGPVVKVRGTVALTASGSERILSIALATITVECGAVEFTIDREVYGGAGYSASDNSQVQPTADVDAADGYCDLDLFFSATTSSTNRAPSESGSVTITYNLTFETDASEACDGFRGEVVDGPLATHGNPLSGIRVQLWKNGATFGPAVATSAAGTFCIAGNTIVPGDYELRATLADARHNPPLFDTRYQGAPEALYVTAPVHASDFDPLTVFHLEFADPARTYVADSANIHWQAARFVNWVTGTLHVSPATLRPTFSIRTFQTKTRFLAPDTIEIAAGDSPYTQRDRWFDEGPENDEWHEVAHVVGHRLSLATAPSSCAGQTNHGGWINTTTCDSVKEGFAMFLATLASLELDQGRGNGYATTYYATISDLESEAYKPWSVHQGQNGTWYWDEDMAVAALLWDLVDDTSAEAGSVRLEGPPRTLSLVDEITIPGRELVNVMALRGVDTIDELREALGAADVIPAAKRAPSIDLGGDGQPDVSDLDAVFLMHGFHPVRHMGDPALTVGDPISRTDHVLPFVGSLTPRSNKPEVAGSYVRFINQSPGLAEVAITVSGGAVDHERVVPVEAGATELVYLQLPPYYPQALAEDETLPACGAADQEPLKLSITAPGISAVELDSCEYLHKVAASTDGAALTVTIGAPAAGSPGTSTPPAQGQAPTSASGGIPVVAIVAVGVVLAAVVGLALVLRRRPSGGGG